jgi:hypothetical protein
MSVAQQNLASGLMAATMIQYVTVGDELCYRWTTHSMSRT